MAEIKRIYTLCYVFDGPKVLLGMKKRGWGAGWWNGFGGKPEAGESIEQAASREIEQEAGLVVNNLSKRAVIEFRFQDNPGEVNEVHIFQASESIGEPMETEEMRPKWFDLEAIPYHEMWVSDRDWLELFFAGKKFRGSFLFAGDRKTDGAHKIVVNKSLQVVTDF